MTFHQQHNIWKIGSVAFEGKHIGGGQKREAEDESHIDLSRDEAVVVDVVESRARCGRREEKMITGKIDRINKR